VEKEEERRNLALKMGATTAIAANSDFKKMLFDLAPYGYDIVIDATGVPEVIQQALQFLKPRGQYLQFGVAPIGVTVQWQPYEIYRKDLTLIGSFALCYTFQPAIAWLMNRVVEVEPLVSHILPLAEFQRGFQDFIESKTLKVHIRP
jgi:threonine dehydrogenase-like Zn-dependent dehydrogenase